MKLKDLIADCSCIRYEGDENPQVGGVSTDSRHTEAGDVFIAIPGYREDGSRYIEDALDKGAVAVVVDEQTAGKIRGGQGVGVQVPVPIPVLVTASPRLSALLLSRALFGYPAGSLTLVGVTGTNGKTTITYLLETILREAGHSPGVIGTVSYRWAGEERVAHNTTPDPVEIQGMLARMVADGVDHVVMEVSSHALVMDRVYPPDYHCAVFTNLSQDHLDFHKSMDDYFDAKARLFEGLRENASAVVNLDDASAERLLSRIPSSVKVITYGMGENADFLGHSPELSITGTAFTINDRRYHTSLVGMHNVYNILAAAAAADALGIHGDVLAGALNRLRRIPGRFERAVEGGDFHVFVDYAHTPDALAHLLQAAKALKTRRIITVFGCGGDRDRGKRPKMGRVVEENSDIAIVTSDNPRSENPLTIIEDIVSGLRRDDHLVIPDRREAIYRAVEIAREDDIVLIAGKGHENYQILGDRTIHFDDCEVARQAVVDLQE
jgi:UDP-N-acetylmuramyl-tripeptide synthetase